MTKPGWFPSLAVFLVWFAVLVVLATVLAVGIITDALGPVVIALTVLAICAFIVFSSAVPLVPYRQSAGVDVAISPEQARGAIGEHAWALAIPGLQELAVVHEPQDKRLVESGSRLRFWGLIWLEGGMPELTPTSWSTRHQRMGERFETRGTLIPTRTGVRIEVEYSILVSIRLTRDARALRPRPIEAALQRLKRHLERSGD